MPPDEVPCHDPEPISIIVAAKNEEQRLPHLLDSIAQIDIQNIAFEVIIVNDHSTDASMDILQQWDGKHRIKVIDFQDELPNLIGKKAAIQKGILAASSDILAFTDADCQIHSSWLHEIARVMTPETDYLLGYSIINRHYEDTDLRLKNFERSIYYALAAAGLYWRTPITSSACNMVYRKSLFERAGGFGKIGMLTSGDDDLLLMRMMPFIRKSAYNPALAMQIVSTEGKNLIKRFNTNVRRASKFRFHPLYLKALCVFVFAYYSLFYWSLLHSFFAQFSVSIVAAISLKTIAEYALCHSHLKLLNRKHLAVLYIPQVLLFPAYFIFFAVRGSLGKYRWK